MTVVVRSLINTSQTLDSVALSAWATQFRAGSTAALVAAVAAKTIQMDEVESGPVDIQTELPLTGASIQVRDNAEMLVIDQAGTIAALTINMPLNPYDGQKVEMSFDEVVTTLTMTASGSGQTLKGALTAATAKGFASWRYSLGQKTWWRVG